MRERRSKRITSTAVKNLKPGQTIWDSDVRGFGVRYQRRDKVYVLKYRFAGRQRWLRIGLHGSPWTVAKARQEAVRLWGEIASGRDPAEIRDAAKKSEQTFAEFADMYMEQYARVEKKRRSAQSDESNLRVNILPRFGGRHLSTISKSDIAKLYHDMRDRPGAANRCFALLSMMFNLAEEWGLRPENSNPCQRAIKKGKKYPERKIERFLSDAELARLGRTLTAMEAEGVNAYAIAAVRLLLFTGARLGEILGLQWAWIDFENNVARLPDSKTGAKPVYLSAPAMEVLSRIPRLENNPHVIVGGKRGAHLVNLQKTWVAIRERAGIPDVRLHDLRHSYASFGTMGGLSLPMLAKLLGHAQTATTERYSHSGDDPLKAANEAIGQRIAAAMHDADALNVTVVPFGNSKR